jgi:septal ring factor EnvC (AmiA/AmiB activator)
MTETTPQNAFVDRAMMWIGSTSSLIVHTILFAGSFALTLFGIALDHVLLVVTTLVSLEAIYMAIFIQMAVNRNTHSLKEVEKDIDEIQVDVDEMQEDVDEIQKDIDEIQEDIDEIQGDVDDIEKGDDKHLVYGEKTQAVLSGIETQLQNLIREIEVLKHKRE